MKLLLPQQFAKGSAFVVLPSGEDFVAVCELAADKEMEARKAMKQLVPLGVFPLHAHLLRYAVRCEQEEVEAAFQPPTLAPWDFESDDEGTSEAKMAKAQAEIDARPKPDMTLPRATIYDVSNAVMLPRSLANIPLRDKVAACCEVVEDTTAAMAALQKAVDLYSSTANGTPLKASTVGTIDVCNHAIQGHAVFFDASNRSVIAAGAVKHIFKMSRSAAAHVVGKAGKGKDGAAAPSITVTFGSTIQDGFVRPAPMVAGGGADDDTPLPKPTIQHLAFMGSSALEHYMSFTVTTSIVTPPVVASSPIAPRCLVAVPQCLLPLFVAVEDEAIRRLVHDSLRLPSDEEGALADGVMYRVVTMTDVGKVPATLKALMEEAARKSGTKDEDVKGEEPPAADEVIDVMTAAPKGILRLAPATPMEGVAAVVDLSALKLKVAIANSVTHIVDTPCHYYHYRVDGFYDDGWGCAYRSLQTVLSWFQHKGMWASKQATKIPSLPEIQQLLAVIDHGKTSKAAAFIGSKEWIGSFEVMLVLQHYVKGLECTLQRIESGAEMANNPTIHRMLAVHFEKGGAPVMIGGAAYAHTIMGINVNIRTTEAQYLIADPHYSSGAPDANAAVQKGWVGWKEPKAFFKAGDWYNMCIPRSYDI